MTDIGLLESLFKLMGNSPVAQGIGLLIIALFFFFWLSNYFSRQNDQKEMRHREEIKEMRIEHSAQMEKSHTQHREQLERIESKHAQQVDSVIERFSNDLNDITTQFNSAMESQQTIMQNLTVEVREIKALVTRR